MKRKYYQNLKSISKSKDKLIKARGEIRLIKKGEIWLIKEKRNYTDQQKEKLNWLK